MRTKVFFSLEFGMSSSLTWNLDLSPFFPETSHLWWLGHTISPLNIHLNLHSHRCFCMTRWMTECYCFRTANTHHTIVFCPSHTPHSGLFQPGSDHSLFPALGAWQRMRCTSAERDNRIQLEFDSRGASAKAGIRPPMGSIAGREGRLGSSGS